MRNKAGLIWFFVIFAILIGFSIYTLISMHGRIYQDEYVFERITSELPHYSTSGTWFSVDRPDLIAPGYTVADYTNWGVKVWIHPPLAYYLYYPVEKLGEAGVFDLYNPAQIRVIPLILMLGTVLLLADIIRRKFSWMWAGLSLFPLIFSKQLLGQGLWMNYEMYMWLFFALSLWLAVARPKHWNIWIWVTTCAMVLCKEVAIALLPVIMLETKNWRYILSGLSLIPFLGWIVIANGSIVWYLNNGINIFTKYVPNANMPQYILHCLNDYGIFTWLVFVSVGVYVSFKKIREYLPYLYLFVVSVLYGLVWSKSLIAYEVYAVYFAGMFVVAIGFSWISKRSTKKELA